MQFRYLSSIQHPERMDAGKFQKVSAMAWSPNGMRLAVATVSRRIFLYDEEGKERDRFNTKPASKNGARNYLIRDIAFNPDSTRLAVAQSDNIVFVYKLGSNWGDKKTICNKFLRNVSVTCMCWPLKRPNEIVFGLADGQVMVGVLKNNKAFRLFSTDSYVVSLAPSPSGHGFISGHLNGKVHRYAFRHPSGGKAGESNSLLFRAPYVPYCLAHGAHITVAGNTGQVQFWNEHGEHIQTFTHTLQPSREDATGMETPDSARSSIKEFTVAKFNPTGQTVVVGNFSCFFTFIFNAHTERWDEAPITHIENLYTVSALAWKPDGSRLATGSLCGAVDLYDACIRRYRYRGRWEFTYTSLSSLVIKTLATGESLSIASSFKYEITKSDIYADRYYVGRTPETLILCDLDTQKVSEIEWIATGKEKFYFDNPTVCMVFSGGELSVVQYGENEVIGQVRTEHMNPHLISTRISEPDEKKQIKKIAFLLDEQSVRIIDLMQNIDATISHTAKIDWLELNLRGSKLLFRDSRRTLHLYDIEDDTRITLLNFCDYAQWVPGSDAVVAQSRDILYVWYRIEQTDEVVTRDIKGDIEEIEKLENGRTQVVVNEGLNRVQYLLDGDLIAFDTALDDMQLVRAMQIMEQMDEKQVLKKGPKGESTRKGNAEDGTYELGDSEKSRDAMWMQLAAIAVKAQEFQIAERAYAALGDVSKARVMSKLDRLVKENGGADHYLVQAQIAIHHRQFRKAEAIYMEQGRVDCALNMYRRLFKWGDALNLARSQNHPKLADLAAEYFSYLLSTDQQEIAGKLKEQEGDYVQALNLYLQGGYPAEAARVVTQQRLTNDSQLLEKIADRLLQKELYSKAGKFLENLNYNQRALDAYLKGNSFREAVDLCRRVFPARVVQLQEQWGDYLASQNQMDAACAHYIEAGQNMKAIDAAIRAKQWKKAVQGLDNVDEKLAQPYLKRIAQHYRSEGELDLAERYYVQGSFYIDAVRMYFEQALWDKAHSIALTYLSEDIVQKLYVSNAKELESRGKLKDATELYIKVQEVDLAIHMYKKNRQYDEMIDLVSKYRQESLKDTHHELGVQFEREGNFRRAEQHYLASKKWQPAVDMYREQEMWEDALRVAKKEGGVVEYKKTAFYFAISVGGDAGFEFLTKRGLGELAVQYAIENAQFPEAFHIATKTCKHKLADVHYQFALALEDEGHFERAEEEFIKANKPKEAIDMYTHQHQWDDAMRVASTHDPISITSVYEEQGRVAQEQKNFKGAENFYINAKKPESAIKMYQDNNQWQEAIRVGRNHVPHLVSQIETDHHTYMANTSDSNTLDYRRSQARLMESREKYSEAIEQYLAIDERMCPDKSELEKLLENAWTLAQRFVPHRGNEVASKVAGRLAKMNKHKKAAQILQAAGLERKAVEILAEGRHYGIARQLASKAAPDLLRKVDEAHQEQLVNEGDTDKLSEINPSAAIEMYANKGEWDKVYQLASKQSKSMVIKCAAMHAELEIKNGDLDRAVKILVKWGAKAEGNNCGAYVRIARAVLDDTSTSSKTKNSIVPDSHIGLIQVLRQVMSSGGNIGGEEKEELEKLRRAAHFSSLRRRCEELKLDKLVMKQSVSILRFSDVLPLDVSFYHAGETCRQQNKREMAFVFFNRFIDICDYIQDDDMDIDETEFVHTDIPSVHSREITRKLNFDEPAVEDIREWALEAGMSDISNELPTRKCGQCGTGMFIGSTSCHNCRCKLPECIVTGWPVTGSKVSCSKCHGVANKEDWNAFVIKAKVCPWCNERAAPVY